MLKNLVLCAVLSLVALPGVLSHMNFICLQPKPLVSPTAFEVWMDNYHVLSEFNSCGVVLEVWDLNNLAIGPRELRVSVTNANRPLNAPVVMMNTLSTYNPSGRQFISRPPGAVCTTCNQAGSYNQWWSWGVVDLGHVDVMVKISDPMICTSGDFAVRGSGSCSAPSAPCQNGGTYSVSSCACQCPSGFQGAFCEVDGSTFVSASGTCQLSGTTASGCSQGNVIVIQYARGTPSSLTFSPGGLQCSSISVSGNQISCTLDADNAMANVVYSISVNGQATSFSVTVVPPPHGRVHAVHYWIEEGKFLHGDLMSPPPINVNNVNLYIHDTLNRTLPDNTQQEPAMTDCPTPPTFQYVSGSGPVHHTVTPAGFTPIVTSFASLFQTDGKFTYVSLPTFTNNVVWNGYDSFSFKARCGSEPWSADTKAFVNVVFTSAASHNAPVEGFAEAYSTGGAGTRVSCSGTCEDSSAAGGGMWYARQTLPRIWDVMTNENGQPVKPTIMWNGVQKDADQLELEWTTNYALLSSYGTIGNMAVRFPTMEEITWKPGQWFSATEMYNLVEVHSPGFNMDCLANQGSPASFPNDRGTDVWTWSTYPTTGAIGPHYFNTARTSWYQKFGGKHRNCDIFLADAQCTYAPLLTPRAQNQENDGALWKLKIQGCTLQWQAKVSWNAMRNQKLFNGNQAWLITGPGTGAGQIADGYTVTANIYNEAVQPNSWTEASRGFAWLNKKYLLKIVLKQDTDFQFELGIDIFTVDLQWFRYQESSGDHAFGYNMILYPPKIDATTIQSTPDRRVMGFKWTKHEWSSPNAAQCGSCGTVASCTDGFESAAGPDSDYTGDFLVNTCTRSNSAVFLFKGPETGSQCLNRDQMNEWRQRPGISAQDPDASGACKTDFQNITLRGVAPNSASVTAQNAGGFGFEGTIYITFLLANHEHPQFQIKPKLFVESFSVQGSFAGSTATCRGSPYWPVPDVAPSLNPTNTPRYLCEEVDARTFGPTDWAIIMFDIKDVDDNLVTLKKLKVVLSGVHVVLESTLPLAGSEVMWTANHAYLHYRNLKGPVDLLHTAAGRRPSYPSGLPTPPPANMDFGFAFTPGAHNENLKITIYCTLSIQTTRLAASQAHRFGTSQDKVAAPPSDNELAANINIQKNFNNGLLLASVGGSRGAVSNAGGVSSSASSNTDSSSSTVTIGVLGAVCAVLLLAVVGMAVFVRRQMSAAKPQRVNSGNTLN